MASSVVLVNGLPGSGKSTLARALAAELDVPLLSKSLVKAGIVGSTPHMGLPGAIYGALAMDVVWALVGRSDEPPIVDSLWLRSRDLGFVQEGLRRAGSPHVVEVWCDVDPVVAHERALASRDRLRARERFAREWDDLVANVGPLGIGDLVSAPSLEPVDAAEVAARIRPLLR
ncbi:hypothetical protein GCM10009846_27270 [Agrococcus versicolor]|uniref:ATP-binding protein n=1 Tax=Agrococcus versicolor TaxID=501482 RepID=A0ABP5MMK1_9MICO